ncbi:MAG TPA: site-2 protease family protein, partial [Clostridiales bacterium]|nr:site-2 protease family protein [Clostridiales bacterium]
FLLAWLLLFIGTTVSMAGPTKGTNLAAYVYTFTYIAAEISLYLMVFNLIPIPPLDGYGVIEGLLPERWSAWLNSHQQIISIVFIALLFTGILSKPLSKLAMLILNGLGYLCALPFM